MIVDSITDRATWQAAFDTFPPACRTLFHSPGYVQSWERHTGAQALCLRLKADGMTFLYPFLKMPVPVPPASRSTSPLWDISSAYGYGGLICDTPDPDQATLQAVNVALDAWCAENNIVAEFIREYPGRHYLRSCDKILVRNTLLFEYENNHETFAQRIKKRARRDAHAAAHKGCQAVVTSSPGAISEFIPMYRALCNEKALGPEHRFDTEYFEDTTRFLADYAFCVNVYHGDTLVASSLNFRFDGVVIYHLSASRSDARDLLPNDLLLYTLLEEGAKHGCKTVFLGGGLTTDDNDSLYRFKEKYATRTIPTHIGTKVHDAYAYDRLCAQWAVAHPDLAKSHDKFFLKYRVAPS